MKTWRNDSIVCDYSDGPFCFLTGVTNSVLDRHHLLNSYMRDFAEAEGLWVYLDHDTHMFIHHQNRKQLIELKKVAQYCYERTHTREEWMRNVRTNYLYEPLTIEQLKKYSIKDVILNTEPLNIKDVKMPWETTKNF